MKHVLLIAGGGTLGTHTANELLRLGHCVDVICLEDKISENPNLHYIKAGVDYDYLSEFLKNRRYDGIVNFMLYTSLEDYIPTHRLLCEKTDHLIFLSSYRVYADEQHPLTETAPLLIDTVTDREFLETEDYAVPKAHCERYIEHESGTDNWTIVRPVISFSSRRFDVVIASGRRVIKAAQSDTPVYLPACTKHLTAGLDWAGNSGKLIANLLWKPDAFREAFTVSSGQNLKWCEVADIYTELLGTRFEWVETDSPLLKKGNPWMLKYDRMYDRDVDNSKILRVTGLTHEDFTSIREGIQIELENYRKEEAQ